MDKSQVTPIWKKWNDWKQKVGELQVISMVFGFYGWALRVAQNMKPLPLKKVADIEIYARWLLIKSIWNNNNKNSGFWNMLIRYVRSKVFYIFFPHEMCVIWVMKTDLNFFKLLVIVS